MTLRTAGRRPGAGCVLVLVTLAALTAVAGLPQVAHASLSATGAVREVQAEKTTETTVYSCFGSAGPYFVPSCPNPPIVDVMSASWLAPDLLPWTGSASVTDVQAGQTSSLGAESISVAGDVQFRATLAESLVTDPFAWTFVIEEAAASSITDFELTLDAPGAYTISGTAQVQYLADAPIHSEVSFLLRLLERPAELELARFELPYSASCPFPPTGEFVCDSGLAPIDLEGVLPAGDYRLAIGLLAAGEGNWLPSVGELDSSGAGHFDVTFTVTPVPLPLATGAALPVALAVAGGIAARSGRPRAHTD